MTLFAFLVAGRNGQAWTTQQHQQRVSTRWELHTEYTQSGNGRFLAYVGCERPLPFTLVNTTFKVTEYGTLQQRGQIHSPYFISTPMYSVELHVKRFCKFFQLCTVP
jgi:hypothetical protein